MLSVAVVQQPTLWLLTCLRCGGWLNPTWFNRWGGGRSQNMLVVTRYTCISVAHIGQARCCRARPGKRHDS